jgi:hypothetical protein
LSYADVLEILVKGFKKHDMAYDVSGDSENSSVVVRFEGAKESDCSLSVMVYINRVEVQRVIGRGVIKQSHDLEDLDDSFFELLKEHLDTIKSLLKMRDKLLGGK